MPDVRVTGTIVACPAHKELDGLTVTRRTIPGWDVLAAEWQDGSAYRSLSCDRCAWEVEPDAAELYYALAQDEGLHRPAGGE